MGLGFMRYVKTQLQIVVDMERGGGRLNMRKTEVKYFNM